MIILGVSFFIFSLLLVYTVFSFFLTLFRPDYGILTVVPIILLGFSDSSAIKGGFIFIVALAVLLNTLFTKNKFVISRKMIPPILLVLLFIFWVLFRSLIDAGDLYFWSFWVLKRIITPGLLSVLILYLVRSEKEIVRFLGFLFLFITIGAVLGILQYLFKDSIFWIPREALGLPSSIAYQILGRVRITGLSSYVIPLSYSLLTVIPILVAMCFAHFKDVNSKFLIFSSLSISALCLVLTFIKSGIGGAFLGSVLVIILLVKSGSLKKQTLIFLFVIFASICLLFAFNGEISRRVFSLGQTSYERIPIWFSAARILVDNPMGVGYSYGEEAESVFSEVSSYSGSGVVLVQFPHNIILGTASILGLPALVIIILFYVYIFKGLLKVYKYEGGNLQIIAIGMIGSFFAYIVNAFFHNNSPFFGDSLNWIFIGLAFTLINSVRLKHQESPGVAL
jgi:O-antigen ligase